MITSRLCLFCNFVVFVAKLLLLLLLLLQATEMAQERRVYVQVKKISVAEKGLVNATEENTGASVSLSQ